LNLFLILLNEKFSVWRSDGRYVVVAKAVDMAEGWPSLGLLDGICGKLVPQAIKKYQGGQDRTQDFR
jgi:hypothetical protein